jgi:hypothetical protein
MPLKRQPKLLRNIGLLLLSAYLVAFTSPQNDDLVELKALMNGRHEAKFRDQDKNKIFHIKAGSRGIVKEVKYFDPKVQGNTGNYGICVQFQDVGGSGHKQPCIWVYYRLNDPNMTLHSVAKDSTKREKILADWSKEGKKGQLISLKPSEASQADAAVTTRLVSGIAQTTRPRAIDLVLESGGRSAPSAQAPAARPPGTRVADLGRVASAGGADAGVADSVARHTVETLTNLNANAGQAMNPSSSCVECNRLRLQAVDKCEDPNAPNAYMQSALKGLLNDPAYSAFFSAPQKEIISTACIQRNMMNFSTSAAFFRQCSPGQVSGGKNVPRACISDEYLNITSKSFNLVADCLGDYVVGGFDDTDDGGPEDPKSNPSENSLSRSQQLLLQKKQQAALSVFAFMAQESGMHINAQSGTGAGGPGQMTGPAIESVNSSLRNIRAHLEAKAVLNPKCSQVLLPALKKPLVQTGAACDRKSPENVIKAMAYAFGYQGFVREHLETTVFGGNIYKRAKSRGQLLYSNVLGESLQTVERDRFMMEISAWAHNTGQGGMQRPVVALLQAYKTSGRKLNSGADVDRFLKELSTVVGNHNPNRPRETSQYYNNIQAKMKSIAPGGRMSCLAN